jgi:hypothetical protein
MVHKMCTLLDGHIRQMHSKYPGDQIVRTSITVDTHELMFCAVIDLPSPLWGLWKLPIRETVSCR